MIDQNDLTGTQLTKITHLEKVVEAMDNRLTRFEVRLSDIEDIVEQLNDSSTQPAANTNSPKTITELEAKLTAVEKQLHAAIGEKHRLDATGNTTPCRIPSIHQLNTYVEGARKRLKNVEDMEGNSKCVRFLEQLKVSNVSQKIVSLKNVERITRAPGAIMSDSEESEFGPEPAGEEAMETEEEIL
jgi:uncharacterized coiled-coil protein SlyX